MPTGEARDNLRRLLQEIDTPELCQEAINAGMRPISQWEIYPDKKQGFRLPLASGRTVLLDKPCSDLKTYIEWQIEPQYCSLDTAIDEIFKIIQPNPVSKEKKQCDKSKKQTFSDVGHVFGSLRRRYASVLIDFWTGRNNPPDSLNTAILLTARMMPYYYDHQQDAVNFIEGLIDDLPNSTFSDRLMTNKRTNISRIIRHTVKGVYNGNGHQTNPQLSTDKLTKTFHAWQAKGFSLIDRSTWRNAPTLGNDFSFTVEELKGIAYLSGILKADLETTANATRHLLRLLANHPTGHLSVRYVTNLLLGHGIRCGHHGKVNEYLHALAVAHWISQIAAAVPGSRGRLWVIGEQMKCKFNNTNKPPSASIICVPSVSQQGAGGAHFELLQQTNPPLHLYLRPIPSNIRQREQKVQEMFRSTGVFAASG